MTALAAIATAKSLDERIAGARWDQVARDIDDRGFATIAALLSGAEAQALVAVYERASCFRKRVVMARHRFGRGEYQYFAHPLPEPVARLRSTAYERLAPLANGWGARLHVEAPFPAALDEFHARCRAAGQTEPTPLLLRYGPDDYNCLHQDLYGEIVFPLQMTVLLSEPGRDFTGGEFVVTEQRPRTQSRVEVVPLGLGDAVIFAVRHRPVDGVRSAVRVNVRHGVSRIRTGSRFALGVIFHDAA